MCIRDSLDSARKVAGNGFYYLMGDIARLHSAVISYARDFMIDRGFTYCCLLYTSLEALNNAEDALTSFEPRYTTDDPDHTDHYGFTCLPWRPPEEM